MKQDGSGAFTTIQACADTAAQGDTCLVYPGKYNEHVKTAKGGTGESARIVFKANGSVTMQGFDIIHPYVTIDGFDIMGYYAADYLGMVSIGPNAHYAQLLNNRIRENDGVHKLNGVKFESVSGKSAHNATIRGNRLERLNYLYFIVLGENHVIEQNTLSEARQWDGFYMFGSGHVVRRNIFWNAGTPAGGNHPDYVQTFSASGLPAENILFEENWIQDLPEQFCQMNSSVDGVGGLVTNVKNFTFRRNVISRVRANCNIGIPGVRFESNTIFQMATAGIGFVVSGSLSRGDGSGTVFRNNIFLEGGSTPATVNGTTGFYSIDGFLFTREVIAMYVTNEGKACAPGCPVATVIADEMIANKYIDGYFNGHILTAAKGLKSIDELVVSSQYAAYKPALWAKLQESIVYDNTLKATFSADYNYVGGSATSGFPGKKSSLCTCGAPIASGNFCEAVCGHGINGGDPKLVNLASLLGPDGLPFTLDDGLKPTATSPLCGKGEGGIDIGAYSCSSTRVFATDGTLRPPESVTVLVK